MSSHNHADVSSLLPELESLTHTQRTKHLIHLGQHSLNSPQTTHLITALSRGTPYAQLLALKTIHGSRDLSLAKHLLSANSKYLRTQAINVICRLGSDEQVLDALKNVERVLQGRTVRRLWSARGRRRRRAGVIDGFLEWLREEGEVVLWRELLPFGGREGLERGLPEVIGDYSLLEWGRLAKCWPEVEKRELWALIEASEEGDMLLRRTVCYIFTQWISHDSTVEFALNLVRTAVEKEKVPLAAFPIGWPKGTLFKRRPAQAVDLIVDAKDDLGTDVFIFQTEKLLRKISLQQFLALTKRYPTLLEEHMFSNLSTEQKLPAYELIHVAWRDENGALGWGILEQLPAEQRIAEARRHLKLKSLDTNPGRRIKCIALLPWNEAMELQKPYLRSSDADIRSEALSQQIKAARYDSAHIEDALKLILSHKNEAATIQREYFRALTDIPASRFKESHLELLTQIVRNALDSAAATIALYLLTEFVGSMLSVYPTWAARQMALIVKERTAVPGKVQLSGVVPVKEVMSVVQREMSAALEALLRKQDAAALTTLARSFEEYMKYWPELLETCNKTFEIPEMESSHEMIMEVVSKFKQPPGFWERIIPLLTKENKNIAGSRHIVRRIHRQYQNLLRPYINPIEAPPSYIRKRDALNELRGGFWRWTPAQQEALTEIIPKDLANEDVTSEKKVSYIWQLAMKDQSFKKQRSEIVRLIGDLETEEAFQWLLETEKGSLHASVRKALLRALWSFLDRDETWKIFTFAAADPEADVAKGVISIPVDSMSLETRQKHLNLLLILLQHPTPEVRLETLKRLTSMPLSDPENVLCERLFQLVRSEYQDEVDVAVRAIFATYARTQIPLIVSLYESLIQDRKLLIRVHDTPHVSQISPRDEMKLLRPATHAILGVLEGDRLSVKRRVRLLFEGLPWEEIRGYLADLIPNLTADALVFLCEQLEDEGWSAGWKRAGDDYSLTEKELAKSTDERARRVALSLLVSSVGENGEWTKEKRDRLDKYREDESVLVAERAWEVEVKGVDDEEEDEDEETESGDAGDA